MLLIKPFVDVEQLVVFVGEGDESSEAYVLSTVTELPHVIEVAPLHISFAGPTVFPVAAVVTLTLVAPVLESTAAVALL